MKNQWKKTIEYLRAAKAPLVLGHLNPEGDCIASTLGMGVVLRAMGANPCCYNGDPLPHNLQGLPGAETLTSELPKPGAFDIAVVVDCGDLHRVGQAAVAAIGSLPVVNIDHHETNTLFGQANFVLPDASATGEVIYSLAHKAGVAITPDLATLLYAAILTDTGCFKYSNASAGAFAVCADLVELGARPAEVAFSLYEEQPRARISLMSKVLNTLEISPCGRIASIDLTRQMYRASGATLSMADGLINIPRSIAGVEIALQFREMAPKQWKISFRSKRRTNVAAVAATFGGGGHEYAAGCELEGSLQQAKAAVFQAVSRALG